MDETTEVTPLPVDDTGDSLPEEALKDLDAARGE